MYCLRSNFKNFMENDVKITLCKKFVKFTYSSFIICVSVKLSKDFHIKKKTLDKVDCLSIRIVLVDL